MSASFQWPCFGAAVLLLTSCAMPKTQFDYPNTRKTEHRDVLHGVTVPDPYRWLEDDNAPETEAWVEAQNQVTFAHLDSIPERTVIRERLTKLWDYEKFGIPFREGGRYFFTRNDGLQNQSTLHVADELGGEARLLLDPNTLSTNGTVALRSYAVSPDGNLMAYGLSSAGSDWQEWRVRDVRTGEDQTDHLKWIKFSGVSWTKDGKGFYYSRYDEPAEDSALTGQNYFHKVFHHRIGTEQSADELIYERPDEKEWGFGASVTDDGNYLIITVWKGTDPRTRLYYRDLRNPDGEIIHLLNDFDADYTFIDNIGERFYIFTDKDAPKGRVIAIDLGNPGRAQWSEPVPQSEDTLRGVNLIDDLIVCTYLKDARSVVRIHGLDDSETRSVELPGIGSVSGFRGKRSDTETFYSYTSFTVPGTIYRYDLRTGESTVYKEPKVEFDPALFETKQVFYASKDGTRIPMFITHKRGLELNGNHPVYLYGYGGFNISLTPSFSLGMLTWMEMGGVYARPNLRGGGEYGEEWHQAGTKHNKQNVFDDFIAAAEWLIEKNYTSPQRLAIAGGSNGGLLVGACMIQRPELFHAALPAVGVLDMLRFHKFTIGWAWTSDYGSPDEAEEFKTLHQYSPYHNLKPGVKYPSTLITTGDHDDRVVPAHSFKFAARLQEYHAGKNPVLIRIETNAGHGAGKPTDKTIAELADKLGFLVREFDIIIQ
ncbi:MAG: prolyl oligopeptidase [Limisphaerales bacterium]|jgi:prolyl oligopeptidase